MTDSKIYVGGYTTESFDRVPLYVDHTFLLYDGDGDLSTTGDQYYIEGAPAGTPLISNLTIYMRSVEDLPSGDRIRDALFNDNVADLNLTEITDQYTDGDTGWDYLNSFCCRTTVSIGNAIDIIP